MMDAISKASSDPVAISAFARHAKELLAPFEKELIDLLQTLVRTNSTAIPPDGCETNAQEVLLSFLNGHGIDAELYELGFLQNSSHPYVRHDRNYSGRHVEDLADAIEPGERLGDLRADRRDRHQRRGHE